MGTIGGKLLGTVSNSPQRGTVPAQSPSLGTVPRAGRLPHTYGEQSPRKLGEQSPRVGTVPRVRGLFRAVPALGEQSPGLGTVPHELEGLWGLFPARGDCTRILAERAAWRPPPSVPRSCKYFPLTPLTSLPPSRVRGSRQAAPRRTPTPTACTAHASEPVEHLLKQQQHIETYEAMHNGATAERRAEPWVRVTARRRAATRRLAWRGRG